jgi:Glycosyltransferase family 87
VSATDAPSRTLEPIPTAGRQPVTATWGREGRILGAVYAVVALASVLLFAQGDIWYLNYVANIVATGHVDVYRYFAHTRSLRRLDTVMPPLYYELEGLYLKLLSLLGINPTSTDLGPMFRALFGHIDRGYLYPGLFLLKLPNLLALCLGFILIRKLVLRFGGDWRVGAVLWLASPFVISTLLMQGQNDLFPADLTLLALVLYRRESTVWTMLLLGLAAGLKSYTLILIPITALLLSQRNLMSALKLGLIGLVPVVLIFGPFMGHEMIARVFHAHDSGTLLLGFHVLKRQVFFWPVTYLALLVVAWLLSKESVDTIRLAAMWLLTLLSIFIVSWWLPQWAIWLLPMGVLLAVRDRWFLWAWIAANVAVMVNNFFILPGNMDGAMLFPLFGEHHWPVYGHILIYPAVFGSRFGELTYTVCMVTFAALAARTLQWLVWPDSAASSTPRAWVGSRVALNTALIAPCIMILVVALMVVQHLIPPPT